MMSQGHGRYSDNDYFRMGAAVAIGQLYDEEWFRATQPQTEDMRAYLFGFGIRGMDDIDALGIQGPSREEFEHIFTEEPSS